MEVVDNYEIADGYMVEILQTEQPKNPNNELVCIVKNNILIHSAVCNSVDQRIAFVKAFLKSKGLV